MVGPLTILVLPNLAKVVVNKRSIVQVAIFEHRYNPYNSSWGLVWEYYKQLLEGGGNNEQPGIH